MKKYALITLSLFVVTVFISLAFSDREQTLSSKEAIAASEVNNTQDSYAYYSDYYVFVADDGGSSLVIPMDINWSASKNGYDSEFKSWQGTKKTWPIAYFKESTAVAPAQIPKEAWEHKNGKSFQFDSSAREIISNVANGIELRVKVPERSEWVLLPSESTLKELYSFRTTASVKGTERSGWMVYERIRWKEDEVKDFGDFGAFYWIPLVVDGDFYLFEQHKGKQIAVKWYANSAEKVVVETIPDFKLNVVSTSSDAKSKRKNIPKVVQVVAPKWDIDITLKSTGSQVGYGGEFPNGLAYYRQSLLQSEKNSATSGYGMLELILEND